jgi:hypothetical protein
MILPERVFGRASTQMIRLRREVADPSSDVVPDLGRDLCVADPVARERHGRDDRLTGELVALRHDGGLGDALVRDDRRLDLGG